MRAIIGREIRFSAAHRLPYVPEAHKCSRLHGHSYRVAVEVTAEIDPMLGWVCDFGAIDVVLDTLLRKELDHRYLNEIGGLDNPTSERLAEWCAARLGTYYPDTGRVVLAAVTVYEGDGGGWARLELR